MNTLVKNFRELIRYPTAIVGLVIIMALLGVSAYALIAIPYQQAISLWRGGEEVWGNNPRNAQPAWTNLFRADKLPTTLVLDSRKSTATKTVTPGTGGTNNITITYKFNYQYNVFPQEVAVKFFPVYSEKEPFVQLTWLTPDGRKLNLGSPSAGKGDIYLFSQDTNLSRKLAGISPEQGVFVSLAGDIQTPIKGEYTLVVNGTTFEPDSTLDAELVVYGKVYGLAGSDYLRRDLMIPILWGTPVALLFGLLAALGTTIVTMIISAIGTWFGGWVDGLIQRITEVNLVLPFLPILIMIGVFYSRSIWVILSATIALGIFSGTIKTYRAIFLQVRESAYIEAARAYGASGGRIIMLYLIPRMIPLIIPQLVTLIPTYVFLEASLSVLGLGDPVLPTWGKIINDAEANGALYQGLYYWVLEPSVLLMITGLAFAMLGFALDRIFNPRLRGI